MQFRVLSDIHLEFYHTLPQVLQHIEWNPEQDQQSWLILAGDIGHPLRAVRAKRPTAIHVEQHLHPHGLYTQFLNHVMQRFLGVLLITGNHEYYVCRSHRQTMDQIDEHIRQICRKLDPSGLKLIFLQCQSFTFPGHPITVHGATLFSPVTLADSSAMNDVTNIASRDEIVARHERHKQWISNLPFGTVEGHHTHIHSVSDRAVNHGAPSDTHIMVTHHVPLKGEKHIVCGSGYYAGILSDDSGTDQPHFWVCGHTHQNIDKHVGHTRVVSCCIGYKNELPKQAPFYFRC